MNGLGNDFNVFDLRKTKELSFAEIIELTKKNNLNEIYDQLLLILPSKKADCFMKIYNIDGSLADACGNGTRCVARIIASHLKKEIVEIETENRIISAELLQGGEICEVSMGEAKTKPEEIPVLSNSNLIKNLLPQKKFGIGFAVNVGNPHIVFFVKNLDKINLEKEVSFLENDNIFPKKININIAEIIDQENIKLITWERGAGATLACGTGACATAYAAYKQKLIGNYVDISMPRGFVTIIPADNNIIMIGDANLDEHKKIEL